MQTSLLSSSIDGIVNAVGQISGTVSDGARGVTEILCKAINSIKGAQILSSFIQEKVS